MKKETKKLQDLLENIASYLEPDGPDKVKGLYDTKLRDRLYGEKPECFVSVKGKGRDISTILPVCNRAGIQDPRIIEFSIKLAKKMGLSDNIGLVDPASLREAVEDLEELKKKVEKKTASPKGAGLKGNSTKGINKIKKYLKATRGQ